MVEFDRDFLTHAVAELKDLDPTSGEEAKLDETRRLHRFDILLHTGVLKSGVGKCAVQCIQNRPELPLGPDVISTIVQ